jgi:uncharacterized protein (TIGR00369 family)
MEGKRLTDVRNLGIREVERFIRDTQKIMDFIGIKVKELGGGKAVIEVPSKKDIQRFGGLLDGGVILAVMDITGALALFSVNEGKDQVTQEIKVNFLEPMFEGPFTCEGKVIRKGKSTAVIDIEFRDTNGKLGAKGLGTWHIIR